MTEAEWVACTDPDPILEFLRGKATDRKLRLFAVACCRRVCHLLSDERSRQAVEVAERYADGSATREDLSEAEAATWLVDSYVDAGYTANADPRNAAVWACATASDAVYSVAYENQGGEPAKLAWAAERANQARLLRNLFGPLPFRPVAIQPPVLAWDDRLVVRLAQAIYDERRWGDMPILGDALLDAGCDNEEVLAHCRAGGEHVRGCWVVDLLLGKS
jgi:hypothetical protein